MATRSPITKQQRPYRDLAIELANSAIAAGALNRHKETDRPSMQQGRLDAAYIVRLISKIEEGLHKLDDSKDA